jgi:shikimate kinase
MNVILCGLPLAGKSYFGKQLSEFLDWPLIDTDLLLEALYKKEFNQSLNCREIAELKGEPYFRELEQKAIDSLKDIKKSIISVGGGTLLSSENVSTLKKLGKLTYLQSDMEILLDRLKQKSQPPSYLDPKDPINSFKELAKERMPFYERYCDVTVCTKGLSDIEVLARISSHLL